MGLMPLKMPQLGESVTEGTVDRWLKKEGDEVRRDEPIVEIVTDKVNAEIPSPFEGKLMRIQVPEGETVPIGAVLAELEVEGLAAAEPPAAAPAAAAEGAPPAAALPAGSAQPTPVSPAGVDGLRRLSPAVRRLLDEHGLNADDVRGTGLGGRVTREDVLAHVAATGKRAAPSAVPAAPAAAAPPAAPAAGKREELVRISAVRRQIADHMVRSVSTSPHAWSLREVDVGALVEYRDAHKDDFQARHGFALSYVPFFIQIVCAALQENPYLNSTWTDDGILLKHYVNMGIAVALPEALIVPVIKDADQKGFIDLARAVNDLASRARSKALRPEDVQGGTFTLNNTGPLGSVAGQSIINQPQAAILSTEAIRKRPVVIGDAIVIRPMMNLTMSFDHRIVDGLAASRFLESVQTRIEGWSPASIEL